MAIKIYCDKENEYRCIRYMIDCGLLNPGFRDANSYKEKFNLEEDKLSVEYDVKEFTENCIQWIKEWFDKNGKDCKAIIGMSGGKDSTVAAALCAKALGPENVIGIAMPDGKQSINDADKICKYLGIE